MVRKRSAISEFLWYVGLVFITLLLSVAVYTTVSSINKNTTQKIQTQVSNLFKGSNIFVMYNKDDMALKLGGETNMDFPYLVSTLQLDLEKAGVKYKVIAFSSTQTTLPSEIVGAQKPVIFFLSYTCNPNTQQLIKNLENLNAKIIGISPCISPSPNSVVQDVEFNREYLGMLYNPGVLENINDITVTDNLKDSSFVLSRDYLIGGLVMQPQGCVNLWATSLNGKEYSILCKFQRSSATLYTTTVNLPFVGAQKDEYSQQLFYKFLAEVMSS
jgi:hypothetical protein